MLKISENNGTEEFGFVTPTPDLLQATLKDFDHLVLVSLRHSIIHKTYSNWFPPFILIMTMGGSQSTTVKPLI